MSIFNFCCFYILLLLFFFNSTCAHTCDGEWVPFKTEFCFKVLPSKLDTYADAEAECKKEASSLAVIHYAEEQQFLSDFLFKKSKLVNSVWIGARNIASGSKSTYLWNDGSDLSVYSNWAPEHPKALPAYCVEMHPDVGSVGKWLSEPCTKNNNVLCQKQQPVSINDLSNTVLALEHNLETLQKTLVEMKEKVTKMEATSVSHLLPLGFIYLQLPKEAPPSNLWPGVKWTDVSKDFAGVFFRVEGGGATVFEAGVQRENAAGGISSISVENYSYDVHANATVELKDGQWSSRIFTGTANPNEPPVFQYSWKVLPTGGEVRPRNVAIKVWKRV